MTVTRGSPGASDSYQRASFVSISGLSYKITFNKELWTSSFPLYSGWGFRFGG